MNEDNRTAIILGLLFMSIAGCCTMREYQEGLTGREKEKTKQMQIQFQAKIDSMQVVNKQI